ncbi:Trypsin and/or CLIP domain containing protein, partial [Asbolus verrucosus]
LRNFDQIVFPDDKIVFPDDKIVFPDWKIEGCATPDGETGICTSISSCQPILDFLDNVPQPLSLEVRNLLKSYICEYEGKKAQVCCPTKPIKIPKSRPLSIAPPPNVDNHRNIKLLPKNCGRMDITDGIFYGNKTGLFEFPWMALLFYQTRSGPDFLCGGTIINNRYILTAAHCISNKLIKVRVGEHDIGTKIDCRKIYGEKICAPIFKDLDIETVIPHPKFDRRTYSHDVALLRVPYMNFSIENIQPVCLPVNEARNYNLTNQNVIITGWGATEIKSSSSELLKVQLQTIPLEECQNLSNSVSFPVTHLQICAGDSTKSDSCAGDSGGPLHVAAELHDNFRFIQQGIVSFEPKCGPHNILPGVYTRVAYYMDWILDNMKP